MTPEQSSTSGIDLSNYQADYWVPFRGFTPTFMTHTSKKNKQKNKYKYQHNSANQNFRSSVEILQKQSLNNRGRFQIQTIWSDSDDLHVAKWSLMWEASTRINRLSHFFSSSFYPCLCHSLFQKFSYFHLKTNCTQIKMHRTQTFI